jgi:RNA polymerase sigma factor (TIGR02999 family)
MADADDDITLLLKNWQRGDKQAETALVNRVYPLLRRLAMQRLRRSGTMTWQPTDLVGEAYAKLFEQQQANFQNRAHFLAIAARVMRRVVADHFRERQARKRGGELEIVSLDDPDGDATPHERNYVDLVEMDGLLTELAEIDPRGAQIVELRYFAGMTVEEASAALDLSERTVKRSWQFARAWLHSRLAPPP